MKKYRYTFEFFDTAEQAQNYCDLINKNYSYYMRKNHAAHYTPWTSQDGKTKKYVVFYYV